MTLNGVMAIILRYFAGFGSFRGELRKSGISHQQIFSREMLSLTGASMTSSETQDDLH